MRILRFSSLLFAVVLSLLLPSRAQNHESRTARDYYNELYSAGSLDRVAGAHVCFQDDPRVDTFFIFGEGKDLRDSMTADGVFSEFPRANQEQMKTDFVVLRGYVKGIPWKGQEILEKDESSWISDQRMLDEHTPIKIRFGINWQTLRYKYAVEVLNMDSTYRTEVASFGRCEEIRTDGPRHGKD